MFHVKHSRYAVFHVKHSALGCAGRGLGGAVILTQRGVSFFRKQLLKQSGTHKAQQQQNHKEGHDPVPAGLAQVGNMFLRCGKAGRLGCFPRRRCHGSDGNAGRCAGFYRVFLHFLQTGRTENLFIFTRASAFHTSHNLHPRNCFLYFTSKWPFRKEVKVIFLSS